MKNLIFLIVFSIAGISFAQERNAEITQHSENSITEYSFNSELDYANREYELICVRLKKENPSIETISVTNGSHIIRFVLKDNIDIDQSIKKITQRFRFSTYSIQ